MEEQAPPPAPEAVVYSSAEWRMLTAVAQDDHTHLPETLKEGPCAQVKTQLNGLLILGVDRAEVCGEGRGAQVLGQWLLELDCLD